MSGIVSGPGNLRTTPDDLMVRLRNAGFGYLLKDSVLQEALRRQQGRR